MENLQQSAFLTGIGSQAQQNEALKQKTQISSLKHNIKLIVSRLPDYQLINQVLSNLGLSYSIVGLAQNIEKQKNITASQLKRIFFQLKMVQKQILRLKSNAHFQTIRGSKQNKYQNLKQISTIVNDKKDSIKNSFLNVRKSSHQANQQLLKKQIQKQLSYRKFIKQLQLQNFQQKKKQHLFIKINNAKTINKKSEKIYKQMVDKQNKSKQAIINQLKTASFPDYSIWAKKLNRSANTAKQNFRTHFDTQTNQSPLQNYDFDGKSGVCSDRDTILIKKSIRSRKTLKSKRLKFYHQNSTLNISKIQDKFWSVVTKKQKIEQTKLNQAIKKVIQKNTLIQLIHKKKISSLSDQSGFFQPPPSVDLKSNTDCELKNIISDQRQNKINNKINQSLRKKSQIINKKTLQVRQRLIKSRNRFLRRKMELTKENQEKLNQRLQSQQKLKQALKQKRTQNEKNIQLMIRKRRQQGEHRQALSQQIMNLKKISDADLQKQYKNYDKKLGETSVDRFSQSNCSGWLKS